MEIEVYKSYRAIQFDGENKEELSALIFRHSLGCVLWKSDWLVYSPTKDEWKKYTNEEFEKKFKTLEQIQNDN